MCHAWFVFRHPVTSSHLSSCCIACHKQACFVDVSGRALLCLELAALAEGWFKDFTQTRQAQAWESFTKRQRRFCAGTHVLQPSAFKANFYSWAHRMLTRSMPSVLQYMLDFVGFLLQTAAQTHLQHSSTLWQGLHGLASRLICLQPGIHQQREACQAGQPMLLHEPNLDTGQTQQKDAASCLQLLLLVIRVPQYLRYLHS